MSEELFGLIFAIIWLTGVAFAWFLAFFKGYDKVWSERIIKFQNIFAFFEIHRRFNKVWNSPKAKDIRKSIKNKDCACPLANASYTNLLVNPVSLAKVTARLVR